MPKIFIKRSESDSLREHALMTFPYECIGVFEAKQEGKDIYITDIIPCKNAARNKEVEGLISKPDMRKIRNLIRRGKRKGFFYGAYHSHPFSGKVGISEIDKGTAKFYKIFKNQIILGVKSEKLVWKAFWKETKKNVWEKFKLSAWRNK